MMYVCGQDRDYDGWRDLGNPGWGYSDMRPLIMKNENNLDSSKNRAYHGVGGPLTVSTNVYVDSFKDALISGYKELNYQTLSDINSGQSYNGYVDVQSTIKNGERCSAYQAFIQPIKKRANLFIIKNGLVTKVLLNGTTAIGVNVQTKIPACASINFYASKETIISAGGMNSPKILLQSGIGPKAHLNDVNINVTLDLPGVGQNFQEHVYSTNYITINPNGDAQTYPEVFADAAEYIGFRTGYFSHLSTVNANGFINATDPTSTYSDVQIISNRIDRAQVDFDVALSNFGLKDEYVAPVVAANALSDVVQVYTTVLNPVARGKIELRGNDPNLKPKITPNFFTNPQDVKIVTDALAKLRALIATKAFQKIGAQMMKFNITECNGLDYPSTEYDQCYIKHFSAVLWHPVGTCKMGPANDTQAVVDSSLRVYGIKNLRVADASIMPRITSGNTQCPCYAIGQKAVAMIKQAWP